MTDVVRLSFKNENGEYKFFVTSDDLFELMRLPIFTCTVMDAKTGKTRVHADEIEDTLKLTPPKKGE